MKVKAFLRKFFFMRSSITSVEIHDHGRIQTKYDKSDIWNENYGSYATKNVGSFEIQGEVLIIHI